MRLNLTVVVINYFSVKLGKKKHILKKRKRRQWGRRPKRRKQMTQC